MARVVKEMRRPTARSPHGGGSQVTRSPLNAHVGQPGSACPGVWSARDLLLVLSYGVYQGGTGAGMPL
jgi:hypothetical protein